MNKGGKLRRPYCVVRGFAGFTLIAFSIAVSAWTIAIGRLVVVPDLGRRPGM
jgi:hypothetical protein